MYDVKKRIGMMYNRLVKHPSESENPMEEITTLTKSAFSVFKKIKKNKPIK